MEAWRQWLLGGRKLFSATNNKTHYEPRIPLTPTGLLMEGGYTQNPCRAILSAMGIFRQLMKGRVKDSSRIRRRHCPSRMPCKQSKAMRSLASHQRWPQELPQLNST